MSAGVVPTENKTTARSESIVQLGALQLYVLISLPLTTVTLLAWYGVYCVGVVAVLSNLQL